MGYRNKEISLRYASQLQTVSSPRQSRPAFSPGYGIRGTVAPADLPPPERLVGEQGEVHHRVYPAPSPIAPPVNASEGWGPDSEPEIGLDETREASNASTERPPSGVSVASARASEYLEDTESSDNPSFKAPRPVVSKKSAVEGTSFIPWTGGVVYENPQAAVEEPISREELLQGVAGMRERRGKLADPNQSRTQSSRPNRVAFGDGFGRGSGGRFEVGASHEDVCHSCGQHGHRARDCLSRNQDSHTKGTGSPYQEQHPEEDSWGAPNASSVPSIEHATEELSLSEPSKVDEIRVVDTSRDPPPHFPVRGIHPDRLRMMAQRGGRSDRRPAGSENDKGPSAAPSGWAARRPPTEMPSASRGWGGHTQVEQDEPRRQREQTVVAPVGRFPAAETSVPDPVETSPNDPFDGW